MEIRDANGTLIGKNQFYIADDEQRTNRTLVYYTEGIMRKGDRVFHSIQDMDGQEHELTSSFAKTLYPLTEEALAVRIRRGMTSAERKWVRKKVRRTTGESPLAALLIRNRSEEESDDRAE